MLAGLEHLVTSPLKPLTAKSLIKSTVLMNRVVIMSFQHEQLPDHAICDILYMPGSS